MMGKYEEKLKIKFLAGCLISKLNTSHKERKIKCEDWRRTSRRWSKDYRKQNLIKKTARNGVKFPSTTSETELDYYYQKLDTCISMNYRPMSSRPAKIKILIVVSKSCEKSKLKRPMREPTLLSIL